MNKQDTVFVVDDDEGIRDGLGLLLETVGQPYESYSSAIEFLDAYDASKGGCLVLDIRKPFREQDLLDRINEALAYDAGKR